METVSYLCPSCDLNNLPKSVLQTSSDGGLFCPKCGYVTTKAGAESYWEKKAEVKRGATE